MSEAAPSRVEGRGALSLTSFHRRLFAEELGARSRDSAERLASTLSEAKVDLHPHQVEAAAFALESLPRGGCLLADEVGLGKTIEAGLVVSQLIAEGKPKILILCPATLRAQWQAELKEKFGLDAVVVDGRSARGRGNCFEQPVPVIASIPFAAFRAEGLRQVDWSLVVIDEAHRLRNAHQPGHKTGKALKAALQDRPKVLLTATPLQNGLGELFGLLSFLDEQILGPEQAFKSRFASDPTAEGVPAEATHELRERLRPVVQRTLRRQVREYVRFTQRRSMVEDFAPSAEEQALYDDVSEYLRRSEATAIEPGKKTLLTLVYRKLLASSTYAIAPTLKKLAQGVRDRLRMARLEAQADRLLEADDAAAYAEEAEGWSDDPAREPSVQVLERECFELEQYAEAAERIRINAKGEALKRALDRVFTAARVHGWPEKAVVFTESKRTQQYLCDLLTAHGFAGKISLLSGDAGSPEERRALVEDFRTRTQILISTEAGAEGLNLQFCNLVVNYDLPWNPQRIEQRIGRCHRYGQQRDVLVLNFLNRQNAADARLYELLEKKLHLFDGVFGASDEVLGALESGLDFERRVLDIYQSCRKPEEIDAAFAALRSDLETRIDDRMAETRSLLLERFDGDVRRRLRLAGEQAQEAVRRRGQRARALSGDETATRTELEKAAAEIRSVRLDAVTYLRLDASGLPTRLSALAGREGWWFAYRFDLSGLRPDERLVHLVLVKEGNQFRALPLEEGEVLSRLPGTPEQLRKPAPIPVSAAQEAALFEAREGLVRGAEKAAFWELEGLREKADRFAEDCLMLSRRAVDDGRRAWEEARRTLAESTNYADRIKARAGVDRLEREYRKKLGALRSEEESRFLEKDRALTALSRQAKVSDRRTLIGTAYFWIG